MEALLLGSIVFAPLAFAAVEPWAFGLLYAVFFGLAARIYTRGLDQNPNPLYKNLLPAVLGVALIGLLQAITERPINAPSAILFTVWRPSTLNAVVTWLFYAAVLYTVPQIIRTPAQLQRLLWTIFGVGVLVALIGMFQKTGENTLVYGLRSVHAQPYGPFVNRDHGASFLALAAMAGLGIFFSGFRGLTAHQSRGKFFDLLAVQLLKLVMLCSVVYGIYRTGSRGGLHSFVIASAVLGMLAAVALRVKRAKVSAFAALFILLAGYTVFVLQDKKLMGLEGGQFDSSVRTRFSMYRSSWNMLTDFPVFGSGLGAVEHAFPPYKLPDISAGELVRHVHSEWLELFIQTGIAGGLLYFLGLGAALWGVFRVWASAYSFTLKALAGGAFGAVLAAIVHNGAEFALRMPANALIFYTLIGALASPGALGKAPDSDEEEPAPPRPAPLKYAVPAAFLAALLSLAAIPPVLAWQAAMAARQADPELKITLLATALKWRPDPQTAFQLGGEYYNQALKSAAPCPLIKASREAIQPYLERVPANPFLADLDLKLRHQSYTCSRPRPNH